MKITKLIFITVGVLLVLTVANLFLLFPDTRKLLNIAREKKHARPPAFSLVTITPDNCSECSTTIPFINALKQQNVEITEERLLNENEAEAQTLLTQYEVEKLPALIIYGAFEKLDDQLKEQLLTIGKSDGDAFLWTDIQPPYKERTTENIRGQFEVTYVTDARCKECYDVLRHEQAMTNVNLTPSKSRTVDIRSPEGRALQRQYTIDAVPTIILSGDLDVYTTLKKIWDNVGTIEEDGTYVFRENGIVAAAMGAYHNLKTGKIITPTPPTQ